MDLLVPTFLFLLYTAGKSKLRAAETALLARNSHRQGKEVLAEWRQRNIKEKNLNIARMREPPTKLEQLSDEKNIRFLISFQSRESISRIYCFIYCHILEGVRNGNIL